MRIPPLATVTALLMSTAAGAQTTAPVQVPYTSQTRPGARSGAGTVNDVALWVNPANPGASRLITSDQNNGLFLSTLDGTEVQALTEGASSSVDVAYGFPVGGGATQAMVLSANPTLTGLVPYVVDAFPDGGLTRLAPTAAPLDVGVTYGTVRLTRGADGTFQAFGGLSAGGVRQFVLTPTDGGITATPVRDLTTGFVTGLVVDQALGAVYVAQQGQGIYRYGAQADGGTTGQQVVPLGDGGLSSVGRLTLYESSGADGYLVAADPNANTFVVFDRRTLGRVGSFQVVQDGGTDGVELSRSLVAYPGALGAAFPEGLFVAHDGQSSSTQGENLKLTSWGNVARAFSPPLAIAQQVDGGTAGDGGTPGDGGTGQDGGGTVIVPGDNPIGGGSGPDDDGGCGCSSASVPASAMLGLLAMALLGRRRRS